MTIRDDEIVRRLDTLVRLVATAICADKTQLQKIAILAGAGLAPKDIAEILGTTPNTVSVTLSAMKRRMKKKGTKNVKKAKQGAAEVPPADAPPESPH